MKLLIFTAPSGAGKTTIVKHLLKKYPTLAFSISATTRQPRPNEIHGQDYYFLSVDEWDKKIQANEFLEWEEVYENQYYGTLKSEVERLWALGKHVVFDIEVKGATNIKQYYGDKALAIFVKPPSEEVLFQRLRNRKTESTESLKKRMARTKEELAYEHTFDVILLNDILENTLKTAENMVEKYIMAN